MMEPWFVRFPRRLEEELQALREADYIFELDEAAKSAGRISIRVKFKLGDNSYDMNVLFPGTYPYVPFEIFCPSFPEGRHKNPADDRLCLLKNPQQTWRSSTDRLAGFLSTQVPMVAAAHLEPNAGLEIEAHEAAQITGYFPYLPGSVIFTGDWQVPAEHQRGRLLLGIQNLPNAQGGSLRGAVLEVQDEKGQPLVAIDQRLRRHYTTTSTGRWIRLSSAPSFDPVTALAEAAAHWKDLATPRFNRAPDLVGFLIPEEVQYRQFSESWVFTMREKLPGRQRLGQPNMRAAFVRADQVSEAVLLARMPNLRPLRTKKALIVGLGSIGSAYAWQMARAGIGALSMIDFDHLQFGNSSRWLLGWPASGNEKAHVLVHHLSNHYPLSTFQSLSWRIGSSVPEVDEAKLLNDALEGVDLVFDATAEWCISHLLSDLSQQQGIPYIWATGTPGARGGSVGRVVPGKTAGCWKCYQRHQNDGSISIPNHADVPDVQPAGCFHPTFTGTGFDMDYVTLAAVRLSVSTLCRNNAEGYPDLDWDVGILNTWSKDDVPISPEWTTYNLHKHAECEHSGT